MNFLFLGIFIKIYTNRKYILRLTEYFKESTEEKDVSVKESMRASLKTLSKKTSEMFRLKKLTEKYDRILLQTDILLKGEELFFILFINFLISSFILFLITKKASIGILGGFLMYYSPIIILKGKIRQRIKEISNQLGDTIILIANSLRAGYSFLQAIETVAEEMPDPIRKEFRILLKEMNLGISTEQALLNLVNRVPSRDLDLVVTAVLIQRQIGGNLSEILDNISTTIRQRVKLKGEIKTLTAQGRMSGWIIALLPVALGMILYAMNKEYIQLLFTNSLGQMMLLLAVVMELIGVIIIRGIVNIEM